MRFGTDCKPVKGIIAQVYYPITTWGKSSDAGFRRLSGWKNAPIGDRGAGYQGEWWI